MSAEAMSHVFISYNKRHDREYSHNLADKLLELGFDVWIDDRIDYGDDWELAIFEAIESCAAFVPIMTPEAYQSKWVRRECQHAEEKNKPAFPILLRGEKFPRYTLDQYVDVRDGKLPPSTFYDRLAQNAPRKAIPGTERREVTQTPTPPRIQSGSKDSPLLCVEDILPPPFEWCEIPGGRVVIEDATDKAHGTKGGTYEVATFTIAKYPITNAQYQVFLDSPNGYISQKWWQYSATAKEWRKNHPQAEGRGFPNDDHPRTNLAWYDAVAFCHWLTGVIRMTSARRIRTNIQILLPTEQQWQRAAIGDTNWLYPWGNNFEKNRCNDDNVETTPVTKFPRGASPFGVMDMSGNVFEWCLNRWMTGDTDLVAQGDRDLRGGARGYSQNELRAKSRWRNFPEANFDNLFGFRIVMNL